ncbi:non-ribosomal peptide synthetase [Methylosinus sp. Sm6]|uniref:non-ribosomal peptide synthetase n=1 Tax=Methylosinus sp. Sm6 TaxID=2866948 RepID=UPI001C99898C|nr:non-ribosomal peptide synthetase [Methylosinus sp. Sm6]MBY6243522.1 amino acid adenylation domain-containing protein [Methylosinus sp. Sm6]
MSFGQERIWFQCRLNTNSALYHIPLLAWLDGDLDVDALEAAINEVIRRHDVLRAGYVEKQGAPTQFILPSLVSTLAHCDLQDMTPETQDDEVRRRAATEALTAFDLAKPPLLRATLLQLAPMRHVLMMTLHHIVWDGWSSGLLIREIGHLYADALRGLPGSLPPLPIQYPDFAYWHRQMMAGDDGRRQIEYWKKRLDGIPELSALRTDRPRPATQSHSGFSHSWRLPDSLCRALTELAREQGVTLFVALLAAFKALLLHYTGQTDVAVGTIVASRTRKELETLLGFFANALVLRTQYADDPSFRALLARINECVMDAQANQDAPFEKLVEELVKKRGLAHNPLFQVAFVLHNLPAEKLELPRLTIRVEETSTKSSAFDLVLHVFDDRPGLRARIEYDCDLFDHSTITRMATHFDALAGSAVEHPDSPISTLSLLDTESAGKIIVTSQAELRRQTSDGALLHQIVGASALLEADAVVSGESRISYGRLGVRARQLAHHLASLGVGPDTPVGVLVEPSVDMIVAILGILEANGAYVPIDPSYPAARIQHIISDSGAVAIVTTQSAARVLPDMAAPFVFLDSDAELLAAQPTSALPVTAQPGNLAYLIYTSGSTGAPKGVMITHGAAVASTLARRQYYSDPVEAYLLLSSIAFDSSVAGVFWTLFDGGRLCIPDERTRRDPGALIRMIEQQSISHLLCLPSLYSVIARLACPEACATLHCVIVAGEECRAEMVAAHFERLPGVALFNEYGPTECTVWNTVAAIEKDQREPMSIGKPAPGAKALVLGCGGAVLPEGVAGELYAGGLGLARGYLGRPGLTAERFLPNPFGAPGERLYRTGDQVRRRADGALDFLGRVDNQVKVRGYRIEPMEIEAVLLRHAGVDEGAVVATNEKGATRLAAFIATRERDIAIQSYLAERLPSYMVPERVVILESLPKLPNGKIDRRALKIETTAAVPDRRSTQPHSSGLTKLLAEIWRDVLGLESVGEDDDFFEIGGNSLSAIQVIARVQQLLGENISVAALFDNGRLREFAREIEGAIDSDPHVEELTSLLAEIERVVEPLSVPQTERTRGASDNV